MKILHLSAPSPQPWALALQPRLTVVHGLAPEVTDAVRQALDAIVGARLGAPQLAAGLDGRVRVGDEQLSLAEVVDRLGAAVPAPPVRASDLATAGAGPDRARALDAEVARAEARLADAEAALAALTRDQQGSTADASGRWRDRAAAAASLRRARLKVADAQTAQALARAGEPLAAMPSGPPQEIVDLAAERVASAERALTAALAARDEAEEERARLDASSGSERDALRAELADVEHRCIVMAPAESLHGLDRHALAAERARLAEELAGLAAQPSVQVADALAAAEGHRGIDEFEAGRVAVEWERVRDAVAAADAAPPPPPQPSPVMSSFSLSEHSAARLARAHDEVTSARRALAEASGASPLDPTDVEALEAAHAEVLAAWEGSEKRIGVGRARRRLEEAQLAEREILARMGFASYTEFMVSGRASGTPSPLDTEEARRTLQAAEARLEALEAQVEADLEAARASEAAPPTPVADDSARLRLTNTLAALRARAVDLLGEDPGDDVADALRERISTDPLHDLRLALDEVGVPLGQVLSREAVLTRAREWIMRAESQAARRGQLIAAQAELDGQIAALDASEAARAAWEAMVARRDELRREVEALRASASVIEAAEERLVRDRAEVDRARASLAEAQHDADAALAAAQPAAASPAAPVDGPAPEDLAALEADARDAQTALDVAVAHLLPPRGTTDDLEVALGEAGARVDLARIERDTLVALQAEHGERAADAAPDADTVIWHLLTRLARQRADATDLGPVPLVLDDPLGALDAAALDEVLAALVGPSDAVQVVLLTAADEIAWWADARGIAGVGTARPAATASHPGA